MTEQRDKFEAAVIRRFESAKGYVEADIRTQCLERNGSGYVAEGIDDMWHFWNEALWKNTELVDPGFFDGPDGLDFATPDEVFDKGPEAVREWQEARGRQPPKPSPEAKPIGVMDVDGLGALVDEVRARPAASPVPQDHLGGSEDKHAVALKKINDIRNSIIGCQTVNWSEHIYPLVAALEEAGIEGAGYPASRANVGTMLERTLAAENDAAVFRAALEAIINPIAAMQRLAETEGAKLDGMMANLLARDPEHLKSIARAALDTMEGQP